MRLTTLTIVAMMLLALSIPASADLGLADWCTNLNGDIDVCNGGAAPGGNANVYLGFFYTTLEPGSNNMGSITFTIGTGPQYVAVYMDYDLDYPTYGSFDDSGTVVGSPSGTQSYELDNPNLTDSGPYGYKLFDDFAASNLLNVNHVGTPSGPPDECCDVSWALAESLTVNSALYSGGTVTFTVSDLVPSGFYLKQTNTDLGDSIYLSDTVSLIPSGGPTVPEPSSVILLATMIAGAALFLRKRSNAKAA